MRRAEAWHDVVGVEWILHADNGTEDSVRRFTPQLLNNVWTDLLGEVGMPDIGGVDPVRPDQLRVVDEPTLTERIDETGSGCASFASDDVAAAEDLRWWRCSYPRRPDNQYARTRCA